jgi:hypothetical protein
LRAATMSQNLELPLSTSAAGSSSNAWTGACMVNGAQAMCALSIASCIPPCLHRAFSWLQTVPLVQGGLQVPVTHDKAYIIVSSCSSKTIVDHMKCARARIRAARGLSPCNKRTQSVRQEDDVEVQRSSSSWHRDNIVSCYDGERLVGAGSPASGGTPGSSLLQQGCH